MARPSRLSGVVIIEAIIDEDGEVKGMRAVSRHPPLIPAALKAVAQRRYEPTILDGEATPIDLRVEISFNFSWRMKWSGRCLALLTLTARRTRLFKSEAVLLPPAGAAPFCS